LPLAKNYAKHYLDLKTGQKKFGALADMSVEQLKEVTNVNV